MSTHVIFGTGTLGAPLARELTARGHHVVAVNRSGSRAGLPDSAELRTGDLRDGSFARSLLTEVHADVAYQLTMPPYHRWATDFPPLASAVLTAAADTSTRLVVGDNLYCYGTPGTPLSESTPEHPSTVKGKVRKQIADAALSAHRDGRAQVALTRPSDFFGADYGLTRSLLVGPALKGRRLQVLGRVDQPHAFSYVPDVARAMADIGTADDSWGRPWVLPAMLPATQEQLAQAIWTAAGQEGRARISAMRGLPMRLLGLFAPSLRASVEMLPAWETPYLVDSSAFTQRFGWSATAMEDAVAETVRRTSRVSTSM